MKKALIIAKYKEDVGWLERIDSSWEVLVYSKDAGEKSGSFIILPNIGRESHTYLTYIIDHYAQLPDICVFTQGNPFDHAPGFLEHISTLEPGCGYVPFSNMEAIFDSLAFPQLAAWHHSSDGRNFEEFFRDLLGISPPMLMYCRMNALFAVDARTIRLRPLSFYEKCLESLTGRSPREFESRIDRNLVEGHFFERMWQFIFREFSTDSDMTFAECGMPLERFSLVQPLLEKWAPEVEKVGTIKASFILQAASDILNMNPAVQATPV